MLVDGIVYTPGYYTVTGADCAASGHAGQGRHGFHFRARAHMECILHRHPHQACVVCSTVTHIRLVSYVVQMSPTYRLVSCVVQIVGNSLAGDAHRPHRSFMVQCQKDCPHDVLFCVSVQILHHVRRQARSMHTAHHPLSLPRPSFAF